MMRRKRHIAPLVALLAFEVASIFILTGLGSIEQMQVPSSFGDLNTWIQTGSVTDIATPLVRLFALVIAYWMLTTTVLSILAVASRIPGAVRATNFLTLPMVRRTVNAALIASIATSSFVSMASAPAMAAPDDKYELVFGSDSAEPIYTAMSDDADSVPTPGPAAPVDDSDNVIDETGNSSSLDEPISVPAVPTTVPDVDSPVDDTTPVTIPASSQTPEITVPDTIAVDPVNQSDSVPTPRVGSGDNAPFEVTTTTVASTSLPPTTSLPSSHPSAPSVTVPLSNSNEALVSAPGGTGTQVLGEALHPVVAGDNLWTIARDALADSSGRQASQLSNEEIRVYWQKVIDANVGHLRSGDPNWIFVGETIKLPPL